MQFPLPCACRRKWMLHKMQQENNGISSNTEEIEGIFSTSICCNYGWPSPADSSNSFLATFLNLVWFTILNPFKFCLTISQFTGFPFQIKVLWICEGKHNKLAWAVYTHTNTQKSVHLQTHPHKQTHTQVCTCKNIHTHTQTHTLFFVLANTYTHTNTH